MVVPTLYTCMMYTVMKTGTNSVLSQSKISIPASKRPAPKFSRADMSLRRNVRRRNVLAPICPCAEMFERRNVLAPKCPCAETVAPKRRRRSDGAEMSGSPVGMITNWQTSNLTYVF